MTPDVHWLATAMTSLVGAGDRETLVVTHRFVGAGDRETLLVTEQLGATPPAAGNCK